jgi:hypothetical protein
VIIVKRHGFSAIRRRKYVSDCEGWGNSANITGTANRYTSAFYFCQSLNAEVNIQYNCLQNVCASPPEEPFEVALWQYAVTSLAVVLGRFFSSRIKVPLVDSRKHRSNGSYMHYVGDGAPAASLETLSRNLRIL